MCWYIDELDLVDVAFVHEVGADVGGMLVKNEHAPGGGVGWLC